MRQAPTNERAAITHHFVIYSRDLRSGGGVPPGLLAHDGYITVGLYEDGRPCELFIKLGSADTANCKTPEDVHAAVTAAHTLSCVLDAFAIAASIALQHGATLEEIGRKFIGGRFEPSGHTGNGAILRVTSPLDYVFRWLRNRFSPPAPATIEGDGV